MTRGTTSRHEIFCLYVVYIAIFKKKKTYKKLGSQHRKSQIQAKNEKKNTLLPLVCNIFAQSSDSFFSSVFAAPVQLSQSCYFASPVSPALPYFALSVILKLTCTNNNKKLCALFVVFWLLFFDAGNITFDTFDFRKLFFLGGSPFGPSIPVLLQSNLAGLTQI